MPKKVSILGSTGSIGTQSLKVCENLDCTVTSISSNTNVKLLENQIRKYRPKYACIADKKLYSDLKIAVSDTSVQIFGGESGLCEMIKTDDSAMTVNAIVGIKGLLPTIAVIESGKDLAIANKETLVAGGKLITDMAKKNGVQLIPVDSEHSAIFQCREKQNKIKKIILTASGGAFFGKTKKELENITLDQALAHPNWNMGKKITIDSSTLMNKGLELIEAAVLFDVTPSDIDIVINRESIIHSAVEFDDNSIIAHLALPDMKIPIQYALAYPKRYPTDVPPLDLTKIGNLSFFKPDLETFDCLKACIKAADIGGLAPCLVNSTNERAVDLFIHGKINFLDIGKLVLESLQNFKSKENYTITDVLETDIIAREFVDSIRNRNRRR